MGLFWVLIQINRLGRKDTFETIGEKSEHGQSIHLGLTVVSKKISYLLGIYTVIFCLFQVFI